MIMLGLQDDAEVVLLHRRAVGVLQHALVEHAGEVGIVGRVPPVGADVDGALREREHRILVAAGEHRLGEERVRVDAEVIELEARHVVAGGRVRVDEAHRLALEVLDLLIGRFGEHVEYRIIALRAVAVDVDGEGVGLHADDAGARERGGAVIGDLDVAGALALDDGGVVVGDAQRHLHADLLAEIVDEGRPAVDHAGGVLLGDHGEHELGIFRLPGLRARAAAAVSALRAAPIISERRVSMPCLLNGQSRIVVLGGDRRRRARGRVDPARPPSASLASMP